MNHVLLLFLSLSVSGTILALILLALRLLIKNKLSQTWQYYVWLVVILRFLLPFTPQISVVGELSQQIQRISTPAVVQSDPSIDVNADYIIPQTPDMSQTPQSPAQQNDGKETSAQPAYRREMLNNIGILWIGIALVLFVHKVSSYRSFVRFVRVGASKITDKRILDLYHTELAGTKIKRQLPLFENNQVVSPMLVGIIRPALIIPALDASDGELRNILRHELTHYKRMDFLYKWIVQVTVCLHWFNPLVHLISKQINKSCELSCDETVIKHLDEDDRMLYGDALIASLGAQRNYSDFVVSMTMSENGNIVKERLDMIMSYRKKSRIAICISFLLTVILLGGFTFMGAYAASNMNANLAVYPAQTANGSAYSSMPATNRIDERLTLIEKEYTLAEIQEMNIAGIIISTESEHVSVSTGGQTLKLRYYQLSNDEYLFRTQTDLGDTIQELKLKRNTPIATGDPERTVYITIPENADFLTVAIETDSGNIQIDNLTLNTRKLDAQHAVINGFAVNSALMLETKTGNIVVKGLSTSDKFEALLETFSGTISIQTVDPIENYNVSINAAAETQISINGQMYLNREYNLHPSASKKIVIESKSRILTSSHQDEPESQNNSTFNDYVPASIKNPSATDPGEIHTNFGETSVAKNFIMRNIRSENYFAMDRIDVVDSDGFAYQGMVFICYGSDSYKQTFYSALEQLNSAYPNSGGKINGYLDPIRDNRLRNYGDGNFSAIEKVVVTDAKGIQYDAYVIAVCGTEEFEKTYKEFGDMAWENY